MGTLTPILSQVTSTFATMNTLNNQINSLTGNSGQKKAMSIEQNFERQNLVANQELSRKEIEHDAKQTREKMALETSQNEDRRRKALKRSIAKQNALRGSGGSSSSGSGEAVLLGLYNESEIEKKQREDLDKLRYNAIDGDLYQSQQRNILEKSQLSERHRVERAIADF